KHASAAVHLDVQKVKISVVGGLLLKVAFETAGPVLPAGDAGVAGIGYRAYFYSHAPANESAGPPAPADAVWTIRGFAPRNRANGGATRYFAFGEGVSRTVKTSGNTISV